MSPEEARQAIAHFTTDARTVIIVDPTVAALGLHRPLADAAEGTSQTCLTIVSPHTIQAAAAVSLNERLIGSDVALVIGGGALIDLAKVANIAGQDVRNRIAFGGSGGTLTMSRRPRRATFLVAVPTTFGTGSENSSVAVIDAGGQRRLLVDPALRPDVFVHDSSMLATLTSSQLGVGALEVLGRLLNPLTSSNQEWDTADEATRVLIAGLILQANDLRSPCTPSLASIAKISAASHDPLFHRTQPSPLLMWLLATQLSFVAGISKMEALQVLWPQYLLRICNEDERFGSSRRLRRAWAQISEIGTVSRFPPTGIRELIVRWAGGVPNRAAVASVDVSQLVRSTFITWRGAALAPFHPTEIEQFFHEAIQDRSWPDLQLRKGGE